jgi:hypothetical protein
MTSRRLIGSALAAALLIAAATMAATGVEAATTWTARPAGHGTASVVVGSPTKLVLGLTGFRARSIWVVSLRRGSCASVGTLVTSLAVTATSAGKLARTVTLTSAQTRLARLPLAIRYGKYCAPLAAPVVAPAPTPTPTPTPEPGAFGDGTWRVGATVQPGTYGTDGGPSCYWARLSGFGGTLDEIIANNYGSGSQIVTIASTDVGFTSSGCGTWRLQGYVPPPPPTCAAPTLCMGQTIAFGQYTITVNDVNPWPDGLSTHPEPAGWTLVSVSITLIGNPGGTTPPVFTIRGPSGAPYAGALPNGEIPELSTTGGSSVGNISFAVLATDVGRLVMTINGSAVVQLY